ncbi:hypothetical protein KKA69_00940 [Patescibacteria group bacterium]|nr:hypothetical protein [Patescibacteria group bacterium]
MGSITGIKLKSEFDLLPFLDKKTVSALIGKTGKNLDKKILGLLKNGDLINLKKGLYLSERYLFSQPDKKAYFEYLANIIYCPSYLSLEYVLSSHGLIPEGIYSLTNVSLKSTRTFENKLGFFIYKNVKEELFSGYKRIQKGNFSIYTATKAKALFDFLYLKRNLSKDYFYELSEGLRINWEEFSVNDVKEFEGFVKLSKSLKMERILKEIRRVKNVN